jgi:hypothetical protein
VSSLYNFQFEEKHSHPQLSLKELKNDLKESFLFILVWFFLCNQRVYRTLSEIVKYSKISISCSEVSFTCFDNAHGTKTIQFARVTFQKSWISKWNHFSYLLIRWQTHSIITRFGSLFGHDKAESLLQVTHTHPPFQIVGYFSKFGHSSQVSFLWKDLLLRSFCNFTFFLIDASILLPKQTICERFRVS